MLLGSFGIGHAFRRKGALWVSYERWEPGESEVAESVDQEFNLEPYVK
jgi:hypothetical protein